MKYFITGISGFIGLNLARLLVNDGHMVNGIVRGPVPEELKDNPSVKFFKGDLSDVERLKEAMAGCERVFHLAAMAKPWAKDPMEFRRINVDGAVNVFRAALESGIKKVVFTSSAATMSPSDSNQPSDENTPRTLPYFNEYESTKAKAEAKALEYCRKGLDLVIVNPTRVYGPGPINPSNSLTRMIAGYCKGSWRIIPGDGSSIGNYVFIDDVVHGHILAAERGRAGERYILGGENLTFNELFEILGKITGTSLRMLRLPLGVMMAAAKMMQWQNRLTGIPPAITPGFVRRYLSDWSLTSVKAKNELGYTVTPFATGAEMTISWLKQRN